MTEASVFDELISEFYMVWFRYHPIAAIFAGVSGYEGLLTADGDDDVGARHIPSMEPQVICGSPVKGEVGILESILADPHRRPIRRGQAQVAAGSSLLTLLATSPGAIVAGLGQRLSHDVDLRPVVGHGQILLQLL